MWPKWVLGTCIVVILAAAVAVVVDRRAEPGPFRYLPRGQPDPAHQPTWSALHVVVTDSPHVIYPGETVHFQVRMQNRSESSVRLDPCPLYAMGVEFPYPEDEHDHLITNGSLYFQLDCRAVPDSIASHDELEVPMRLHIPPFETFRCQPNNDGGKPTCLARDAEGGTIVWRLVARRSLRQHYAFVAVRLGE